MRNFLVRQVLRTLMVFIPLIAVAQGDSDILQSDWIKLIKGYRDPASGVEMRDVVYEKSSDTRTLTLAIPKSALQNPDDIEEVIVVGQRPAKPVSLDISYEWLEDDDPDNYGLVIRLGKDSNWPIRLYLDSRQGYQP